jgi:hypothetical protein
MTIEMNQKTIREFEIETARLLFLLNDVTLGSQGGKDSISEIRLTFGADSLNVKAIDPSTALVVAANYSSSAFSRYNPSIGTLDIKVNQVLERLKASFKIDNKITISVQYDKEDKPEMLVVRGNEEVYKVSLQKVYESPDGPYPDRIITLRPYGYVMEKIKTWAHYKIDGAVLYDNSGNDVRLEFADGKLTWSVESIATEYVRTINAREIINKELKSNQKFNGKLLAKITSRLKSEIWVSFTEEGPVCFSQKMPYSITSYIIAPKSV